MIEMQVGAFRGVKTDDLPWRPSTMAPGVLVKDRRRDRGLGYADCSREN
jgi:hypothetical protein